MVKNNRIRKKTRIYSEEEKQQFYELWKSSGMRIGMFCEHHDLTKSVFYGWRQRFEEVHVAAVSRKSGAFSAVTTRSESTSLTEKLSITLVLPSQLQLQISLREDRLVGFLQELCHATAIIR